MKKYLIVLGVVVIVIGALVRRSTNRLDEAVVEPSPQQPQTREARDPDHAPPVWVSRSARQKVLRRTDDLVSNESLTYGWLSTDIPRGQSEVALEAKRQTLENAIAQDLAAGINAQVREREAHLRKLAEELQIGMTPEQVIQILGSPDSVKAQIVAPTEFGLQPIALADRPRAGRATYYSYSPIAGVPFDARHGLGFQALQLRFDTQTRLEKWCFETPLALKRTLREEVNARRALDGGGLR